jgi:hypothetical protein
MVWDLKSEFICSPSIRFNFSIVKPLPLVASRFCLPDKNSYEKAKIDNNWGLCYWENPLAKFMVYGQKRALMLLMQLMRKEGNP